MLTHWESALRLLDIDDLYLLSHLGKGLRLIDVAKRLRLSQPAITQRVHKIEGAFGIDLIDRSFRGTKLTDKGGQFCHRASVALAVLETPKSA